MLDGMWRLHSPWEGPNHGAELHLIDSTNTQVLASLDVPKTRKYAERSSSMTEISLGILSLFLVIRLTQICQREGNVG
jgi:hypothetical protein